MNKIRIFHLLCVINFSVLTLTNCDLGGPEDRSNGDIAEFAPPPATSSVVNTAVAQTVMTPESNIQETLPITQGITQEVVGGPGQPSKVAYIIEKRIRQIEATLAASGQPQLSAQVVSELSDDLIQVNSSGGMLLEFHSANAIGPAEIRDLEARGATVIASTADLVWPQGIQPPPGLGIIVVLIPYSQVQIAAEQLPWVTTVTPVENNPPDMGTFLSEGVALHSANRVQTNGIDGRGVVVGVISDGISNLAASQGLGELPATVTIPTRCSAGSEDEGTAMLEIIADMAPGATLQFCASGSMGPLSHVAAQLNLVTAGADVIVEDMAFDTQPAFQKGLAVFAGESIASTGVSVHSSAGNLGDGHTARVVAVGTGSGPDGNMGPFDMTTNCVGAPSPSNVVAIAPGGDTTFDMHLRDSTTFTLQWSEPRSIFPTASGGGFTNLDLFVFNAALTQCLGESVGIQGPAGIGDTIEQLTIRGLSGIPVKIVVNVSGTGQAAAVPILDLRWRFGAANIDTPTRAGSLNPDSNYTNSATSAGAADASVTTGPGTISLEDSSGGGPVQLLLTTICPGNVYPCPGTTTAGPSGVTAIAPTWTAADGVSISGVGGFGRRTGPSGCPATTPGDCRFFGTSAAVPHAAACDALIRQSLGGTSNVGIINQRLLTSAIDRDTIGPDNDWGGGILDCLAAIQTTPPGPPSPQTPPGATIGFCYRVQMGETLATVAQEHGVTEQAIIQANLLNAPIYPQQALFIPQVLGGEPKVYIVKPGDTWASIADTCHLRPDLIAWLSKLDPDTPLEGGEVVTIPIPPFAPPSQFSYPGSVSPSPKGQCTYQVQPGDTLYSICRQFHVSVEALIRANGLSNPNQLQVGQCLVIPSQ